MTRSERRRRRIRRARRQRMLLVTAVLAVATMCASFTFIEPAEESEASESGEPQATEIVFRGDVDDIKLIPLPVEIGETPEADPLGQDEAGVLEEEESDTEDEEMFFEEIPLDRETQSCVMKWCEEYHVKRSVALGVIQAESSFQADAKNGSCFGYMQINSINQGWLAEEIGVTDLTDPHQNIQAGIYMLSDLYGKYGDWNKALTCYNYGEGGAYEHVFSKGETSTSYSRHVLDLASEWAEVVGDD